MDRKARLPRARVLLETRKQLVMGPTDGPAWLGKKERGLLVREWDCGLRETEWRVSFNGVVPWTGSKTNGKEEDRRRQEAGVGAAEEIHKAELGGTEARFPTPSEAADLIPSPSNDFILGTRDF